MFKFSNNLKNTLRWRGESGAGFTLIEIIIGISILSFGIILVYGAFSTVLIATHNLQARFSAAYLAQEGLEITRNLRDNNFIAKAQDPLVEWSRGLVGSPCNLGCMVDYKTQDYTQIIPWDNSFLYLDGQGFYTHTQTSLPTIFKRRIIVNPVLGLDEAVNVSVTIFWDYNGRSYTFDANEDLYNWY